MVAVSAEAGVPTLRAQADTQRAELTRGVQGHPLVQAVMARFPGAEITRVSPRQDAEGPSLAEHPQEEPMLDDPSWLPGESDDES